MRFSFYYWPLPFRGVFARSIFAATEHEYRDEDSSAIMAIKKAAIADQESPVMAPPFLWDREKNVFLSQLPAIVYYLGHELNMLPADAKDVAECLKLLGDCNDILGEITRANGAQMWDQDSWKEFIEARFPRWLEILDRSATKNRGDRKWLFGDTPSIGDTTLFSTLGTMHRCLPGLQKVLDDKAPAAMELSREIEALPGVAAMVADDARRWEQRYCGGYIEASIRTMLGESENK